MIQGIIYTVLIVAALIVAARRESKEYKKNPENYLAKNGFTEENTIHVTNPFGAVAMISWFIFLGTVLWFLFIQQGMPEKYRIGPLAIPIEMGIAIILTVLAPAFNKTGKERIKSILKRLAAISGMASALAGFYVIMVAIINGLNNHLDEQIKGNTPLHDTAKALILFIAISLVFTAIKFIGRKIDKKLSDDDGGTADTE